MTEKKGGGLTIDRFLPLPQQWSGYMVCFITNENLLASVCGADDYAATGDRRIYAYGIDVNALELTPALDQQTFACASKAGQVV
jgi:hypothetical protein